MEDGSSAASPALLAPEPPPRFVFPSSSRPCRITLEVAQGWRRKSATVAEAVDRAETVAKGLGCELQRVVLALEGASTEAEHGVFWTMAPNGYPTPPSDTDGARRWLDGLVTAESRLLADDATTIAALDCLRRIAEIGG